MMSTCAEKYDAPKSITQDLVAPVFQQAIVDCVYIYFKYWQAFCTTDTIPVCQQVDIIHKEHKNMLNWLKSMQFQNICCIMRLDEDYIRISMLKILHNKDDAYRTAQQLNLRITQVKKLSLALALVFLFATPSFAQPFPPPQVFSPITTTTTIPELKALVKVSTNTAYASVKGKLHSSKVTAYTYLDKDGNKINLPFKVKGVKDATAQHPITARVRLFGRKVTPFLPFLNAAGSIAQILSAFHI